MSVRVSDQFVEAEAVMVGASGRRKRRYLVVGVRCLAVAPLVVVKLWWALRAARMTWRSRT
jgi:hypothetical protein